MTGLQTPDGTDGSADGRVSDPQVRAAAVVEDMVTCYLRMGLDEVTVRAVAVRALHAAAEWHAMQPIPVDFDAYVRSLVQLRLAELLWAQDHPADLLTSLVEVNEVDPVDPVDAVAAVDRVSGDLSEAQVDGSTSTRRR